MDGSSNLTPLADPLFYTTPPDVELEDKAERKTASLSKTKAWKEQKEFLETRRAYWQQYLPGNIPVEALNTAEHGTAWIVAVNMVREIDLWINNVESIGEAYSGKRK